MRVVITSVGEMHFEPENERDRRVLEQLLQSQSAVTGFGRHAETGNILHMQVTLCQGNRNEHDDTANVIDQLKQEGKQRVKLPPTQVVLKALLARSDQLLRASTTTPSQGNAEEGPDPAVKRAQEILFVPMLDVPPLAMGYLEHLQRQVGMCIEVCLTAYAAYAQCVEGLPCRDEAYVASPDAVAWFEKNRERLKP